MNNERTVRQEALSKYSIYHCSSAASVKSIQTAAQFGDKEYIRNALEKSLDADVNAMVQH
jgi:hypothetical protein